MSEVPSELYESETENLKIALRVLIDAASRYDVCGPTRSVKEDLARGVVLGEAALDPDLGRIKPGHVCKHGIRWPHSCAECDDDAYRAALAAKTGDGR